MKIHDIDNSLNNLGKTVLWQYDRAVRLLSVMKHMQMLYHCAVEQFWKFWIEKVLAIDTVGGFGCSIWGIFLGVPRPTIKDSNGNDSLIATSVYRRVLKGAFYLMKGSSSFKDILGYIEIVFGIDGEDSLSKWSVEVSEYGWHANIDELNDVYQAGRSYAEGDIFCYDRLGDGVLTNWKCLRNISVAENISFNAIADFIIATTEPTNGMGDDETLLLKLYDPEGICRKIGGAPSGSLTITTEYEFGETTIRAVATRRRKCGIMLTDNEDLSMSYSKSVYYEEMHDDQKALFEQKQEEFCPYPLGIKTNEPIGRWVFGVAGQSAPIYKPDVAYAEGDIFGHVLEEGRCCNYKCKAAIPASENTSFKAIEDKVEKTHDGGPLIKGFGEMTPPYFDIRKSYHKFTVAPIVLLGPDKDKAITVIPPNSMFVGKDGAIDKIFKNTSGFYFFVYWRQEIDSAYYPLGYSNYKLFGADTTSADSHAKSFAKIATEMKCPAVPYSMAIVPQTNTSYSEGMTILVQGERRVFNAEFSIGDTVSEEAIIKATSPESNAGLHAWYPYAI